MRQRTSRHPLAVTIILLASGCSDGTEPRTPGSEPESSPVHLNPQVTADDPLSLARAVPGFGGFYLDGGTPVVYLKNSAQRGNVERALAPFLRDEGLTVSQLRIRPARYGWAELERWFTQASPAILAAAGGIFVDADEASNRVLIGVERGTTAGIRALLGRLGIPEEAVTIRETEPMHLATATKSSASSLGNRVRPAVGGIQINFLSSGSSLFCTLGFNALRNGRPSFITNTHCSKTRGATEGTLYYQPNKALAAASIGSEVSDPAYLASTSCPAGYVCRYSDASRSAYASGITSSLGKIAKTAGPNISPDPTNNPKTITGSFSITAEGNALVGQTVSKIGYATGWTRGKVTNSCVNTVVAGTNIVYLCQNIVAAGSWFGDSGSPVFKGNPNVTLTGILWGVNDNGTLYAYSPIRNIERELGSLTTF